MLKTKEFVKLISLISVFTSFLAWTLKKFFKLCFHKYLYFVLFFQEERQEEQLQEERERREAEEAIDQQLKEAEEAKKKAEEEEKAKKEEEKRREREDRLRKREESRGDSFPDLGENEIKKEGDLEIKEEEVPMETSEEVITTDGEIKEENTEPNKVRSICNILMTGFRGFLKVIVANETSQ